MDWAASQTDRLDPSSASPAPEAPSTWAHVVERYLEALRVTHYAADTVHVRTLYLKYFTAWATAHDITKPQDVTRADVERYQVWQLYTRVSIRLLKAVHTATHPAATLARPAAPLAAASECEPVVRSNVVAGQPLLRAVTASNLADGEGA